MSNLDLQHDRQSEAERMDEVASHLAIARVLTLYSRGIDRCDVETLQSVWWPEATTDYGQGPRNALEWSVNTVAALSGMIRTQHMIGNMLIEISGDQAEAETYIRAYHELESPQGKREMVVGGRYLDRLERRRGDWKIASRRYVMDWNTNTPSTSQDDTPFYARLSRRGGRKPSDPLYTGE